MTYLFQVAVVNSSVVGTSARINVTTPESGKCVLLLLTIIFFLKVSLGPAAFILSYFLCLKKSNNNSEINEHVRVVCSLFMSGLTWKRLPFHGVTSDDNVKCINKTGHDK